MSINYYYFLQKNLKDNLIIDIPKNSNLKSISNILVENEITTNNIYPYTLSLILCYEKKLSFGEFLITPNDTLFSTLKKIRNSETYNRQITIVEGYEKYNLLELINKSLLIKDNFKFEEYNLVGETFSYNKYQTASEFLKNINDYINNFLNKRNTLQQYNNNAILIIGSLVEKEGMNDEDKRLISSVIFNRLEKNMKLDIDASVIFSITEGNYKFDRKLTYDDLKIDSAYNTYRYKGLPPKPICIPGLNTLKVVLEKHKSDFFYYFFDENKNSHIFSKNYKEHLKKLNEYKKNK